MALGRGNENWIDDLFKHEIWNYKIPERKSGNNVIIDSAKKHRQQKQN